MKTIIELYAEMAKLTEPHCAGLSCKVKHSCCSAEYCEMSRQYALEKYDTILIDKNHPTLPFMTDKGCIVPPHMRPWCTLHVCSINGLGIIPKFMEDTNKYFELREQIEALEN